MCREHHKKSRYASTADGVRHLQRDLTTMAENCINYWQPQNAVHWGPEEPGKGALEEAATYVRYGELMREEVSTLCNNGLTAINFESTRR